MSFETKERSLEATRGMVVRVCCIEMGMVCVVYYQEFANRTTIFVRVWASNPKGHLNQSLFVETSISP